MPPHTLSDVLLDVPSRAGTISMATGIIAISLHNLPLHFPAQGVLSTTFFVADVIIFFFLFGLYLLKIFLRPHNTWKLWTTCPDELFCLPSFGIAFSAITTLTGLIPDTAASASWRWGTLAYVMFWISVAENLLLITMVCTFLGTFGLVRGRFSTAFDTSFLLVAVSPLTTAVAGATIASRSMHLSGRQNVPIIVVSYFLTGLGLWLCIVASTLSIYRIFAHPSPPREKLPGTFLLLGPLGQGSAALFTLAGGLQKNFATFDNGSAAGQWLDPAASKVIALSSDTIGILLYGMAFWILFFVAAYLVFQAAVRVNRDGTAEPSLAVPRNQGVLRGARGFPYSLAWWSIIFPIGTFATATDMLASEKIGGIVLATWAAILLIIMVILWFVNLFMSIKLAWEAMTAIGSNDKAT
ncbi:hypothetical protein PYCC9005_004828 [Savitreella phatthalungensis]